MTKPKVGREYQHLEDLTFIEGSQGALSAVSFLEQLAQDSSTISLKWDGSIVIYWGRDDSGDFVLTGKNGWGKSKSKSAEELAKYIMTTGKGEPWRPQFADDMSKIFVILEQATPEWFRGYVKGDVLWHPNDMYIVNDSKIVFTPNQVTYYANIDSNIGKQIVNSKLGIAVHSMHLAFGSSHGEDPGLVQFLENRQVVLFSQTYIANKLQIDCDALANIKEKIQKYASNIDYVLESRKGMSDIKNIIYSYVNYMVKNNVYHHIEHYFDNWLQNSSISNNKKEKIKAIKNQNNGLSMIFSIIKELSIIKDNTIKLLDKKIKNEHELVQFENVHEGYVCNKHKIKLVPRTEWKPR